VQEFAAGNPTAITTSSYRYDGLGRRIEKVANGQTTRYIYDGEDILLEYNGSNVLQARYTHGPGIDEPLSRTPMVPGPRQRSDRGAGFHPGRPAGAGGG
jgi:YD repeat-containing protein